MHNEVKASRRVWPPFSNCVIGVDRSLIILERIVDDLQTGVLYFFCGNDGASINDERELGPSQNLSICIHGTFTTFMIP